VKQTETEIEMVERHIRVGEALLARQRKVIEILSDKGLPTEMAYILLQNFEEIQSEHRAHLESLLANRIVG
jgi:hypothetical protein